MVWNNQKIVFFILFWGSWAHPKGPKNVHTDQQEGGMYILVPKTWIWAPNQINRPILIGEMVQNSHKMGVYAVLGHLGTPNWSQKVHNGPQVGGMYVPMSKLKNKPLNKSIGPFL